MSGVVDLFSIGTSGVRSYRAAMGAVSENIANANTSGYNRRSVELMESPTSSSTSEFYKPGVAYGGVEVQSIARANDQYLDLAARLADSTFQNADARKTWQSNIQGALDDGSLGVGQLLGTMYSSVERLASNPSDTTLRTNVLFSFEQINQSFKQTSDNLQTIKTGIASTATNDVNALNDAISRLASTNESLRRAVTGSSNAAQLLDQRDSALSDIAAQMDTTVTFGDHGVADVTYNGAAVVSGINPHTFAVSANTDGTLAFTLDGASVAAPLNGTLAGLSQSATTTAQRIASVDSLAQQYVSDINTWHHGGVTAAGVAGGDMLAGTNASNLSVVITDPAEIAGASPASAGGAINGNLIAITTTRGSSGVENGWAAIISSHANLLSATNAEQAATSARNQQAQNARGDVSGVDLDREAADLIRLQQAYQGCARIIQVARECTQAIFDAL